MTRLSNVRPRVFADISAWLALSMTVLVAAFAPGHDASVLAAAGAPAQASAVVTTFHAPRSAKQTPGVQLTLDEMRREPGRHGTRITYRVNSSGFSRDKTYRLEVSSLSLSKPVALFSDIRADESGALANGQDPKGARIKLANVELSVEDYNDGEVYMVAIVSDDAAVYASDSIYPFPIAALDGGCRVWAELLSRNHKTFGIKGSGFGANSSVKTASWEGEEKDRKDGVERVRADDSFAVLVEHRKATGVGTFSATGDSCSVILRYDFGRQAKGPR